MFGSVQNTILGLIVGLVGASGYPVSMQFSQVYRVI